MIKVRPFTTATAVAMALALSLQASAQSAETTTQIDLPAQPLAQAIQAVAQQASINILVDPRLVEGREAPAVKAEMSIQSALNLLLRGTGLTPRYVDDKTITLVAVAPMATKISADGSQVAAATMRLAQSTSSTESSQTAENARSDASSAGASGSLEEIVVTAQKREQNLQDVGISISAIGGRRIEELGLQNLNDLMGQVPGVSFSAVGPGEGNLVIRGIATSDLTDAVNNRTEAVGVYINDTPVGKVRFNPDISPFDLERVEVLRGPQGTLYGSGSLAGTVRFITSKPNMREFATKVGADLSATKGGGINHRLDAMANIPLSDTFALRVVGYQEFDDGYIRGVGPGHLGHDENDAEKYGGRVAARWQPTDRFTADLSAMLQRLDSDMGPQDNPGYAFSRGVSVSPYEQYRDSATFARNRFNLYNLTLGYDLGWGNLTSSTSLLDNESDGAVDVNATIQAFYGVDLSASSSRFNSAKDLSQELRLATDFEGPLNFIGGVFYTDQEREQYLTYPVPGFDAAYTMPRFGVDSTAYGADVDEVLKQNVAIDERQVALFGELTYELTEKLSATAGLRWFDVEQDYFIATAGIVASGNPPLNRTSGESGFNPKFLVSYAVSDEVLVSAQAARGFRLGGTNELVPQVLCGRDLAALGLSAAPETFQSENVWNYEVNAKTSWLDRHLTVNGSVYHIDYKDIQVLTPIPCAFPFTDNGASARSRGVELELTARQLDGLELSIGGAYTDAELTVDVPQLGGKAGDQLPMSARFTGNATARYQFPLGGTTDGFVQYSYRYTDRIPFSFAPEVNPARKPRPAPAYDLHNLRVGLKTGLWSAALYLNNVFDEDVISYERNFYGGAERRRTRGQPRTVGLSVSANF